MSNLKATYQVKCPDCEASWAWRAPVTSGLDEMLEGHACKKRWSRRHGLATLLLNLASAASVVYLGFAVPSTSRWQWLSVFVFVVMFYTFKDALAYARDANGRLLRWRQARGKLPGVR
jgi:hypothetical protein